jgi:hypothetical protein
MRTPGEDSGPSHPDTGRLRNIEPPISDWEDTLRYVTHFFAAVLVAAAFVTLSELVIELMPHLGGVAGASAAPAASSESAPPEYFPDRFRDVKVWDERPQPEVFWF